MKLLCALCIKNINNICQIELVKTDEIKNNECPLIIEHFKKNNYTEHCLHCECLDIYSIKNIDCQVHNCEMNKF
jgi:hypothetical protein